MKYYLSSRHTIQDGRVVTIAPAFEKEPGISTDRYRPIGGFEISVSRNAVMIHRATFGDWSEFTLFSRAMEHAKFLFAKMRRGEEIDLVSGGPPRESECSNYASSALQPVAARPAAPVYLPPDSNNPNRKNGESKCSE